MKHGEFIERMAKYKPYWEYSSSAAGRDTTNKDVAGHFGVLPQTTAAGVKYYDRHKAEPQRPEYADMTHSAVVKASHFLKLSSMEELRRELIKHYGVVIDSKLKPHDGWLSRRIILKLLENSGLEWFEKKNRPFVHWKHQDLIA